MRQDRAGHPVSEACRDLKTKSDVLAACRSGAPYIAPSRTCEALVHAGCCLAALQLLLKPGMSACSHTCCAAVQCPRCLGSATASSTALPDQAPCYLARVFKAGFLIPASVSLPGPALEPSLPSTMGFSAYACASSHMPQARCRSPWPAQHATRACGSSLSRREQRRLRAALMRPCGYAHCKLGTSDTAGFPRTPLFSLSHCCQLHLLICVTQVVSQPSFLK